MSTSKATLKAISAAIKAQNYEEAIQQSQKLLGADSNNYQANLFLGFALDKQAKHDEAEKAYNQATVVKGAEPQAWQGLIQMYEKQGSNKLSQYQNAALNLARIYQDQDEKYKCQDVVDKFLSYVKAHGTRLQQKEAQHIVLPESPIYDYLEGRLPHPGHTYQIIAQITEFEEKERTNKEIGERRTRLGAKIGQVTVDVKREVLQDSDLEDIYAKIIDWSTDDEIRRQYEEKLLQRCLDALTVLPPGEEKNETRSKTLRLASDMVIIKHPFKTAWDITLEWRDPESLHEFDANLLREYYGFFPSSGLGQVLRGYMTSEISPFSTPAPTAQPHNSSTDESEDDDDDGGGVVLDGPLSAEDRLVLMTEGMSDAPRSILAHRLMGEYYQFLEEHEVVVELMRRGRRLIADEVIKIGMPFENSSESLTSLLGTALVFYQSPKNHPEAKVLFEGLLERNPTSTPALIGIGLIYEEEEDYSAAIDFLERALKRDASNIRIKAELAWVKALHGEYMQGQDGLEACLPEIEGKDLRSKDLLAQTQHRIGVCLWNIDTSKGARRDRSGAYSYFLASLKSNLNYAPAYTSLGVYYADYANDKKRSRKCFQKAFELSSSEVLAAERLAKQFAEQSEWELVEVVAQRVVDSGKVKPSPGSKKKGVSWPFAALGVAELNKQDYAKSIVSFQSALRVAPEDYHSWVGLGESYHHSGRYTAASKAFQHAEKFEPESGKTWFAKYMLANVERELGEYDTSINGYKNVLESRPGEYGVSIALIQTLVESAWDGIGKGLFGQAAQRASETINTAAQLSATGHDAFNLWRAVGDACSVYSWVQNRISDFPRAQVEVLLQARDASDAFDLFAAVDGVGVDLVFAKGLYPKDETAGIELTHCLHAAVLFHKRAIHSSAHDVHAQAVAYYNLGWAEHRAHVCLSASIKKKSSRYLKAAVRCFKRAIELEAGNSEFWNALGVVTSVMNPGVAQHSLVRSLFLNERSPQAWTNLGTLYLLQNDIQLANDAFARAQSSDPDFAHAWVGQGIIALMTGNPKEADLLFTHAMEISESSSIITKRQYAQSTFDQILTSKTETSIADLVQPLFALNQLQCMTPTDLSFTHLSTLFLERVHNTPLALEALSKICTTAEADYEVTESATSLSRFSLAKADLARVQLAATAYPDAIESGDTAVQLTDASSSPSVQKTRLSAHLTVGLAHALSNDPPAALEYFESALKESNDNLDAICLLVQVLWAKNDENSKDKAREILFEAIENHPDHIPSVLLLGVIALLDNDTESLEAVTSTLHELRASHHLRASEQSSISELLRSIAALSPSTQTNNESSNNENNLPILTELQTDIMLHPFAPHGWHRLSTLAHDTNNNNNNDNTSHAAEMALKTALRAVIAGTVDAEDLAAAYAGTGSLGDAQRAVFVAPWEGRGWESLAEGVAAASTS